jgi:RNA-directed DNA polymerase
MRRWKSDSPIVLGARESRVHGEGAGQSETGLEKHCPYTRRREKVSTQLAQITKKAELDRKVRFTSLAHLLTPEFLKETWGTINRHGAGGVDGESIEQFESELELRVQEICARLKAGAYRAPPVRRVDIPKGPGKTGTRPLGIPTVADRLLQKAVARILEAIFEADFCDASYGYRPGRSPHHALRALREQIVTKKGSYVFEADIRGYFDHVCHSWLQRMVRERIADPVILSLIGKWLKAGAMQDGVVVRSEEGTPQGGPISCVLANIYLHYTLDLWFEKKFKPQCRGEAYLVRFVDDFVVSFQYLADAENFQRQLRVRLARFNLELAEEKTRLLLFGRFAAERCARVDRRPETFEFLGFKHVCGTDRAGRFALIRLPSVKSCRKFLARTHEWLVRHMHWKRRDQQRHLWEMLRGFYQYFRLHHCQEKLDWIRREVQLQWRRTLRQQSQRHRLHWSYLASREWFKLPLPPRHSLHPTV